MNQMQPIKLLLNSGIFVAYSLCSGSGLILLKTALSRNNISFSTLPDVLMDIRFLIGFSLYVCGFLLWMYILAKYNLNVAFPIAMALFFVVSSLGSYYILGETFSPKHIFGMLFCFTGILLLGMK
jgi:drug/metabolite transporter (DMT)-like permease